jgi:WD40 repeat protein
MDSDYCYGIEMQRALERHQRGEARVIPIILRHVYWQGILGTLQALPTDAKPVRSALWHSVDEAFFDVAEGIRTVVVQLGTKPVSPSEVLPSQVSKGESEAVSLILTLTGHTYSVDSVAISPDGQTLASGSGDQTIKIWGMKEMNRQ